ncbi:MAG: glycosyltransferase family 2 protein [Pseudomonadota bacterium]
MKLPDPPSLSVIVVVHDMPQQAMNTLHSLSPAYQRGVSAGDYEVLVMENASANTLSAEAVRALGENFHYQLREESGVSPAPAINAGLARCRGAWLGLLIDGARMLTPRVIDLALRALSLGNAVVAVPGYYLTRSGATEGEGAEILAEESALLARNHWREDGYALFDAACFSNGNRHGFMEPLMECNALFCEKELLHGIGGADERFNLSGGGALNLHLYRQLATSPGTQLYMLAGEGNFHQFHGGTSTTAGAERDERVKAFKAQLDSHWPEGFKGVRREPVLFGPVETRALPFLEASLHSTALRAQRLKDQGRKLWEDEHLAERAP